MTFDPVLFDPQVDLPPAEGRLATVVARLPRVRIQQLEHEGCKLWVKRAQPVPRIEWRRELRDRLVRVRLPGMRWLPRVEWGAGQVLREARRLVLLSGSGIPVPEIAGVSSHWIALVDCGESMRSVLKSLGLRNRRWLLAQAATDLGELHAAGFWHGGAQVKNTVMSNGRRVRIDFDEAFDESLTLVDLQARDLFFFLLSCADWLPQESLSELVDTYRDAGDEAAVAAARAELSPICGMRWVRMIPGGDLRRVLCAARVLHAAGG